MTTGLQLGRPGIYEVPVREPDPVTAVRLDVAGFVGVALRGPVNVPTLVISWADYQNRFGGLEPGSAGRDRLLPYAVQAFFAQGGRRAVVVRVAAAAGPGVPSADEATAAYRLGPAGAELSLTAADEGVWGSGLSISLGFSVVLTVTGALVAPDRLRLPRGGTVPAGSLLRIRFAGTARALRWAAPVDEPAEHDRLVELDEPLPVDLDDGTVHDVGVEVITGTLLVLDRAGARRERIERLGLHPDHPRYLVTQLGAESLLVVADHGQQRRLRPDPMLASWPAVPDRLGLDRSEAVGWASFFDPGPADADPLDEAPAHGVDLIAREPEAGRDGSSPYAGLGILCVPDLSWRADRDELLDRQRRVVEVADLRRRFVALLDVPPGLPTARMSTWRAGFNSAYAAGYAPWLGTPRGGDQVPTGRAPTAVLVPPSAYAAGIMADRELRLGLPHGPANQLAIGAVRAADLITDTLADDLHQLSINVFAPERDGFRLVAGRTLATDPDYHQLSVRRLVTMIALTLQRYGELLVFEPNSDELRARATNVITALLRGLHRDGAFAGRTEEESFFVRCDASTNPSASQAQGRLIAEVGLAPAAPLEYLVLRIAADGEGGVLVSERSGVRSRG